MANTREIQSRMKSIQDTMKITNAMYMISSTKLRKAKKCSNHYAFRAGRNLPDKEFRYLRTVIVTAAVYRGFGSVLRLR